MRAGIPSVTALAVAVARGIGALPGEEGWSVADPVAHAFVPLGGLVARAGRATARSERARYWASALSLGLCDHVSLRTAAIDEALDERLGVVRQLVIVGAGLDARAWRIGGLAGVDVFEVDHPSTQRFKRARAGSRAPLSASHCYVSVDFERDSLDAQLDSVGHDKDRPSFWIWEGVTMYLQPEATRATLEVLSARSAPGSGLAMTYATPRMGTLPKVLHPVIRRGFGVLGEPLRGLILPEDMQALAGQAGWEMKSDTGSRDWARSHRSDVQPRLVIDERLMVGGIG